VIRELLGVLLEARAHVEAHGAQLERERAQLERLDARVSTLEHGGAPRGRAAFAGARPHERRLTLLDLSSDALDKVLTFLAPDDELAASLACRKLRDALRGARSSAGRTLETRVGSLLGSLGMLQWGVACAGVPLTAALLARAAGLGDLRMLSWLRANGNGCPWDKMTCSGAAKGGHMAVLQWARANGCPWDEGTCSGAAWAGHLSVLQWARANGCPWDEETCSEAAGGGHLSVLQWLHANGCPWDEYTCSEAAAGGHLSVLQWAHANGCPDW
jgi:hypothetical protein